ncbi:TetR family transcriptional regulator [Mycobacterium florentinum]|uniref:TetR family transcriptional regulator n=1 Tax=Mycobacterium florentinum TaxID=292462 RepID=A0A1X1U8N8_MYCFL|nr:TetR/AcrR family transcriptional regulator [Mycobacterium florentinum]MCV7410660.1 TetR/AcrR family transcriptional regulator [Mycobacterium florentinum]ORV53173.1 TetR family transcriptional regulator [Mycobacterium florentinum]BBX79987.1 TetR family transcriptional regulator [Mycobacterium florentinum]
MNKLELTPEVAATRQAILEAATTLLGERDYPATSIRDIARAVDLLPGRMYDFIENKEAILYEIVATGINRFVSMVDAIADDRQPPDAQLRRAIIDHVKLVSENPRAVLVVFHQWRYLGTENRRRVIALRHRYEQFFRDTVEAGIADGLLRQDLDVQYAVFSILGALNWVPEWLTQHDPQTQNYAEKLADVLLSGVLVR